MAPGVVNGQHHTPLTPEIPKAAAVTGRSAANESSNKSPSAAPWHLKTDAPYKSATASLVDRYIDEPRPLRVAVIGGGLAGIVAGILLPVKVPGIELTIFEKNPDFVSISSCTNMSHVAHPFRAAPGWKIFTLASDATFRLTSTNLPLSQNMIGATNFLLAQKSETTGSLSLANIMSTG